VCLKRPKIFAVWGPNSNFKIFEFSDYRHWHRNSIDFCNVFQWKVYLYTYTLLWTKRYLIESHWKIYSLTEVRFLVQNKSLHIAPVIHVRYCYKVAHILIHTYHPWMHWLAMSPDMLAHISLPWHLSNPFWRHWSGHPHIILRVLVKNQSGFLTQLSNFTLACIISYWGHFSKIFFLLVTTRGLILGLKIIFCNIF